MLKFAILFSRCYSCLDMEVADFFRRAMFAEMPSNIIIIINLFGLVWMTGLIHQLVNGEVCSLNIWLVLFVS